MMAGSVANMVAAMSKVQKTPYCPWKMASPSPSFLASRWWVGESAALGAVVGRWGVLPRWGYRWGACRSRWNRW